MRPTLIFAALAMAGCGAIVAPTGTASAEQSAVEGYYVNIDRIGSAPLDECILTSIRNPHTVTNLVRVDRGRKQNGDRDFDLVVVVVSKSIQVSLDSTS